MKLIHKIKGLKKLTKNLKGTYCLVVELENDSQISVGKLGRIDFKKGYYVYVGSALNSLKSRLKRHLSSEKKIFWHVDYLLDDPNSKIVEIVFAVDGGRWECSLGDMISTEADVQISNFGCSDCRCRSHLFYFKNEDKSIQTCINSLKIMKLKPKLLDDLKRM